MTRKTLSLTERYTKGFSLAMASTFVLFAGCLTAEAANPSPLKAQPLKQAVTKPAPKPSINIIGATADSPDVKSLMAVVQDLLQASNQHDLQRVLSHYSPKFVSGDNLSLEQIRGLIEETWKLYPDIRYNSELVEIRVNGDWATVESKDLATATAKAEGDLGNTPGVLESRSRGLLFLHKIGKTWEIRSDHTLYEEARIYFGSTKDMNLHLSTPEQVFAGESYSARLSADLPKGLFAIATISKDPLVYPQPKPEEKFRTLTTDRENLERVFEANTSNNNEIITAIIGLTEVGQDPQNERPTIKLNGVATLVKRVNVLPKAKNTTSQADDQMVKTSASGQIDTTKTSASEQVPSLKQGVAPKELPSAAPSDKAVPSDAAE